MNSATHMPEYSGGFNLETLRRLNAEYRATNPHNLPELRHKARRPRLAGSRTTEKVFSTRR